jgi:hypothetical protein
MDETVLAAVVRPDEAESPASNEPMLKVMHDLEEMAAKLLATARELPLGSERHGILKEIGKFRVRITALKAKGK